MNQDSAHALTWKDLGWSPWWAERAGGVAGPGVAQADQVDHGAQGAEVAPELHVPRGPHGQHGQHGQHAPHALHVARVAAVDRDQLLLLTPQGEWRARLSGRYRHEHPLSHERPCVGDWVCVDHAGPAPQDGPAIVHALLARRTWLRRKAAGLATEHQMIAANVDGVFIVQACHFDFNLRRLERCLAMTLDGGAEPCILLTKTDLVTPEVLAAQRAGIAALGIAAPVIALSNLSGDGVAQVQGLLKPGRTYCFVGSSGVGKSTLINRLAGRARQSTGAVSGTGEGRHTTVRRELLRLEGGALVIDNPGMRELGLIGAEDGIVGSFAQIAALAAQCRYADCHHGHEPGCAVRAAVQAGELCQEALDAHAKLLQESAFNAMSQAERRQKDRDFGRFMKTVKKDLRRR